MIGRDPGDSLPLFAPKSAGGYYMPTVERVPGVFVEPCRLFEHSPRLEVGDVATLMESWHCCTWTGIGYEAGRNLGRVSFLADIHDGEILYPQNWYIGEAGARFRLGGFVFRKPGEKPVLFPPTYAEERVLRLRPWAVEFSKADRGDGKPGFVRRRFWYPSRHRIPTFAVKTRAEVRLEKERRTLGRLVLLLAAQRARVARGAP